MNRYPDPHQKALKLAISNIKKIPQENIFVGNGSDEAIDLLFRAFCEPAKDNIITMPPTYGMYKVSAKINNIAVREVLLDEFFDVSVSQVLSYIDTATKIIYLCSPNNPTGNSINQNSIKKLLLEFNGLVVVDEAYIDFSSKHSLAPWIQEFPNLIILQTLSKAWGLAAARIGLCFANESIVSVLNKIKPPYNISGPNQQQALLALDQISLATNHIATIIEQRLWLINQLKSITKVILTVYPSDANFILVKVIDANNLYHYLSEFGIIVRNRSKEPNCENCLRISVGTEFENQLLVQKLKSYAKDIIH